ncbi:MAG TPA: fasciclin domain-containing protein [Luteimonas sp.]|nr:fasciclin domain-containing protein [Luteimonas sp.]
MSNISSNTSTLSNKNIVDTAAANGSFKTFGKALRQADMVDTLRGEGPFTLFAPTDAAFDKLPAGKLDNLMKPENKAELVSLLKYHVLTGRSSAADVAKLTMAKTVNGQSAPIVASGTKVSIDGAELTARDIQSSNGVLHGIDKVNIPTKH